MSEIILRHLDALEASLRVGLAQIEAARHAMGQAPKSARLSLPERCAGQDADLCAEQDGEWLTKGTLANPGAKKCHGCGYVQSGLSVS